MKVDPLQSRMTLNIIYGPKLFLPLVMLLMLSLTACLSLFGGGGEDGAAPETLDNNNLGVPPSADRLYGDVVVLPPGPGNLTCTESCSKFGQCGVSDIGTVVLLNQSGPAGKVHDWAIPDNAAVDIRGSVEEPVVSAIGEAYTARFYNVTVQDRGQAWVAGWCVSAPAGQ